MGDITEKRDPYVDLLIVGAGPAGLMLAAWASEYNISARIVDMKSDRVQRGHADGLHSRTLEIMDSFGSYGLADRIMRNSYHIKEICSWNPDLHDSGKIQRTQRVVGQPSSLSRFEQLGLHQGMIEQYLLDHLQTKGKVTVERNTVPERLEIDEKVCGDSTAYAVTVDLRRISAEETAFTVDPFSEDDDVETIKAKYVIGCDGAHSWTRHQLGLQMEGDRTDQQFGVMDIVPITNFPDIRQSCVIHSKAGSVMTVPKKNRLVRLYVQLGETAAGKGTNPRAITPEEILAQARKCLSPYDLDFKVCDWHSRYTVGQRLAPRFSHHGRVFLAGDAVHTHSPTLGQGMNVSMGDTYNLGWKICSVLNGTSKPDILSTYDQERRAVAQDLITLDKRMADFYSNGPSEDSEDYQYFRDRFSAFTSGVAVTYKENILIADAAEGHVGLHSNSAPLRSDQNLAKEIRIGQRLPSHKVVCQAEATVIHIADVLPSDGRWRIMVFAGDLAQPSQMQKVQDLGTALQHICSNYHMGKDYSRPLIDVVLVHAGDRTKLDVLDLPEVFHPWDESLGWNYWKVLSDDAAAFEAVGSAYEKYGIEKRNGCIAILRPDQHVAYLGPIDDSTAIEAYFSRVLVEYGSVK